MKIFAVILAAASLAACSDHPPVENPKIAVDAAPAGESAMAGDADATMPAAAPEDTTNAPEAEADYLGRWTGVEGMYLGVAPKAGGGVTLEMQWDLDNKGTFDGSVTAEGLRFMRNGVAESAVHTDGDATGLKYLAGKRDCLTVKSGEGYCRD